MLCLKDANVTLTSGQPCIQGKYEHIAVETITVLLKSSYYV